MTLRVPLSILDLIHVTEGHTLDDALLASMQVAQLADDLGYHRLWYAEHHNTAYLGASATSVLIARAAALTRRIRVGSGGVMLPNHAPLHVAEAFGTLARFFPNRIDLGVGRAPGTDPITAQILGRSGADLNSFLSNISDLTGWFSDEGLARNLPVTAGIATGTHVPIWVLGSSIEGAAVAAKLGLPFCIASHFAPDNVNQALAVYRSEFNPSAPTAQIAEPYVIAGINVMIAPTNDEAQRLWTTSQRMIVDVRLGKRRRLQPPVAPEDMGTDQERAFAESILRIKAVGTAGMASRAMEDFACSIAADELITMTYAWDPADRLRSMRLLAEQWFNAVLK